MRHDRSRAALLLESVWIARLNGDTTLATVIGAADYVNHEILDRNQIEDVANQLRSVGMIEIASDGFLLTDPALQLIDGYAGPKGGMAVLTWLTGALPTTPSVDRPPWRLDEATYDRAVLEYRRTFDR